MRLDETSVCCPHDLLELPELAEETWVAVVDLFRILVKLRMDVALDVPDTVWQSATLGASDLLLFETPVGQFDLVREEHTASHDVNELELCLNSSQALLGVLAVRHGLDDLYAEQVVGVTLEALVSICGDLILPVSLSEWRTHIVRVQTTISGNVVETDERTVRDPFRVEAIPSVRSGDGGVSGRIHSPIDRLRLVLNEEDIVLIFVRVESDLLLLATSRVHVRVGVQVATLGVVVTETDARAKSHVCGDIGHSLGVECGLELAAHEAIAITRVDEANKVDGKHGHVEGDWDDDQAEDAGEEVLEPQTHGDILGVADEDPELQCGDRANPRNGEESDPLDTRRRSQAHTGSSQPKPPSWGECLLWSKLVLVDEREPGETSQGGEDNQRSVQKDQARLGDKAVLKSQKASAQSRGDGPAS